MVWIPIKRRGTGDRRLGAWAVAGGLLALWVFNGPPWPLTLLANLAHLVAVGSFLAGLAVLGLWGQRLGGRRAAAVLAGFGVLGLAIQGGRWISPRPALEPARGAASSGAALRVVTFNLGTDLAQGRRLTDWLRDSGADLVALEELPEFTARELEADLGELYPHRALFPGGGPAGGPDGVNGRGLLSKYPIVSAEYVQMEQVRKHLRVELSVAGRRLEVLVLHLAAETALGGGVTAGGRDLNELLASLEPGRPVLICGDLNTTERSSEWKRLRQAGLTDAFRSVRRESGYSFPIHRRYRGYPSFPIVRIDYVWHSAELRAIAARLGEDVGSDHFPLIVDLEWVDSPH